MKVRVARELVEGRYQVTFQVGEFTSEEVKKMSQFGTPTITLIRTLNSQNTRFNAPITQVPQMVAAFPNEQSAKTYQDEVLQQLKSAIDNIRAREDNFTSTEEIAL
jgi:hypothetical protein